MSKIEKSNNRILIKNRERITPKEGWLSLDCQDGRLDGNGSQSYFIISTFITIIWFFNYVYVLNFKKNLHDKNEGQLVACSLEVILGVFCQLD